MRIDADPFGPSPKSGRDPRLTKVGRILREYSLDELPQLFNVIKGDISLVGPRPTVPQHLEYYGKFERRRLEMRPGITVDPVRSILSAPEGTRTDALAPISWILLPSNMIV